MTPSVTSTRRALMPSGGRNALTAFETASMPVSEEPPLANARSRTKIMPNAIRPLPVRMPGVLPWQRVVVVRQRAERLAEQADDDHEDNDGGEQVGGHREGAPGLADPAQVAVAHQDHDGDRDHGEELGWLIAGTAEATAAVPAATWTATVTT